MIRISVVNVHTGTGADGFADNKVIDSSHKVIDDIGVMPSVL